MVIIAIAGSSGNVAKTVIDGILSTKRHRLILLSTKDASAEPTSPLVRREKTSYEDPEMLAETLKETHTVLCFITPQTDPGNSAQKTLIDACVLAGVVRYAPSEWATSSFAHLPWYSGKAEIRQYLEQLNAGHKVLEYCLFQPGMFTNYFAAPYKTSKYIHPFQQHIDFNQRKAIGLEGGDTAKVTLTTVHDFVEVVVRALDFEGEWPVVGGLRGDELTLGELYALGEQVRGGPIHVERLQKDDLVAGVVKSSWLPRVDHPAIPADQIDTLAASMTSGMILGMSVGVMSVSDEWNKLLPDYKFTSAADFLSQAWADKP